MNYWERIFDSDKHLKVTLSLLFFRLTAIKKIRMRNKLYIIPVLP